jgi:urea transport system ATP-binding protein
MTAPTTPALLYLDAVTVSFDGFKALNSLSLTVDKTEMRAIIGPNGAGKTTMMDVITGKTRPTSGTAVFAGSHDLTRSMRPPSPNSDWAQVPDSDRVRHAQCRR